MERTLNLVSLKSNTYDKGITLPKLYAFLLVLLPVLLPYKFPFSSYSFSTILCIVLAIISVPIILCNNKKLEPWPLLVLAIFFAYAALKSNALYVVLFVVTFFILLCLSSGFVKTAFLRKLLENFSIFASIGVIIQTVFHYAIGGHIPMVILPFCTDSIASQYNSLIQTGLSNSFYRPSSFFLEPSHFTQFCFFGLASSLFRSKINYKKPIIITIGIIMTTSGIGIMLVLLTWLTWFFVSFRRKLKKHSLRLLAFVIVAILLLFLLFQIPFVNHAISRIFGNNGETSAIQGRWFYWDSYFGHLKPSDLLYGFGQSNVPTTDVYFTGFMEYLWAYGILGFTLYSLGCLFLFFNARWLSKFLILIVFSLVFFTNQTNMMSLAFNLGIIVALRHD